MPAAPRDRSPPAPAGAPTGAAPVGTPSLYILTTSCPDTTGVVASVAGFLAEHNANITEAQHHNDPYTRTSFMRTVFHDDGDGMPDLETLDRDFAAGVGKRLEMRWRFHDVRQRCRVLIAVSRQGHCLNSLLHRWSTATLPVEVVAVVSNHPCRSCSSKTRWRSLSARTILWRR